ncbi:WD40-repeat-containing domain protein [Dichotomopilus funicola]|uniref:WD40-repeat-containing domain protein n=1 Tax=Dichotomopilus funicola TaxID=1934379 RepID=A0AAN6ZQJ1_9PEZI|nr:WD40-repeat-containing domain protein [Dichotomopilus funicola]
MADNLPPSSPTRKSATTSVNSNSNPNLLSPPRPVSRGKERRNPSITPRKFRRFFTPRSRISAQPTAARKALCDLTAPALNRYQTPSSPLKPISEEELQDSGHHEHRGKRRKFNHLTTTPEKQTTAYFPSPLQSSPLLPTPDLHPGWGSSPLRSLQSRRALQDGGGGVYRDEDVSEDEEEEEGEADEELVKAPVPLTAPVPLHHRGLGAQLVQRMTGAMRFASERALECPVADWRTETADFQSRPQDVHYSSSHEEAARAIPFCTTACHNNSLVAVGDEEGYVRLLDSNKDFSKIHLSFKAHGNAIIDMAFSEDDRLLATASGDQTGRVIDMMTQNPISVLGHHTAALKQVRFQPGRGSGCVLATSGRDGSVQIWDLRCRGGPIQNIPIESETGLHHRLPKPPNPGCVVNSIYDAHTRTTRQAKGQISASGAGGDIARIGEVPGRLGEVSVTALQFLPPGREHLLLTACEADASVKLWDIRAVHTSRHHKAATPVSYTAPPASHVSFRPFGVCSMALGGDGTRLYALCKDNTVYAYSTAHLVLGHAPELTPAPPGTEPPRRRHHPHGSAHEGLGPLYGFRHPLFHATSFYVKAAIRPASDGRSELLAVGSSDGAAVLFPTDERYLRDAWSSSAAYQNETYYVGTETDSAVLLARPRSGLRSSSSSNTNNPTSNSTNLPPLRRTTSFTDPPSHSGSNPGPGPGPLSRRGTPLVRGHGKEVGAVAWTADGKLVTVGDDFLVRCWSEDRAGAADLRLGGETEGRRWGCGWADVGDRWEGDGDDW